MDHLTELSNCTSDLRISQDPQDHLNSLPQHHEPYPETPKIRVSGIAVRDITEDFLKASKAIKIGQLVKDEFFTLYEAVGALEIMDPKMDSGFFGPGEKLTEEYNLLQDLSAQEVIGIIDHLFCLEMAWHKGSPLSQTVFTCLYIDKLTWPEHKALEDIQFGKLDNNQTAPGGLVHQVLRPVCLGLLKCCDFVQKRIFAKHCYEEEDFVTLTYNRSLLSSFEASIVTQQLDSAVSWLKQDENLEVPVNILEALLARVNLRKSFLCATAHDLQVLEDKSTSHWADCQTLISVVETTNAMAIAVPGAFSNKVQRKLASTVPPRPIVEIGIEEASCHFKRLCQDSIGIAGLLEYKGTNNMLNFVASFQAQKPSPSAYVRAMLQSYIFNDMKILGNMSIKQILFDDLAETVLPADVLLDLGNSEIEVPHDPRFQISKLMESFIERATGSYLDLFYVLCQNRSRTRRTLCHTIGEMDQLQLDLEVIDNDLRPFTDEKPVVDSTISAEPIFEYPLSSWAFHHKLAQMKLIIQLGFELEIYQVQELAGMYWHLQYITQVHIQHLERIRGFVTRKLRLASSSGIQHSSDPEQAFAKTISFINIVMLEATATEAFAEALTCLYTILGRLGQLQTTPSSFSSDLLRYNLRMKPFLPIALPSVLPYDQFSNLVEQPTLSSQMLLAIISKALARARKNVELLTRLDAVTARAELSYAEYKANTRNVLRACIAASIAVATVAKILGAKGATHAVDVEIPLPGKGYHDWWVVPKITVGSPSI
ncbi:MAG: hypothetical protein M1829_006164 [Trizodia sp. TS-e1964]|nr:MAG: hypothetical protein M1829_006164 [Trizodia sp. TS-e1964]